MQSGLNLLAAFLLFALAVVCVLGLFWVALRLVQASIDAWTDIQSSQKHREWLRTYDNFDA